MPPSPSRQQNFLRNPAELPSRSDPAWQVSQPWSPHRRCLLQFYPLLSDYLIITWRLCSYPLPRWVTSSSRDFASAHYHAPQRGILSIFPPHLIVTVTSISQPSESRHRDRTYMPAEVTQPESGDQHSFSFSHFTIRTAGQV